MSDKRDLFRDGFTAEDFEKHDIAHGVACAAYANAILRAALAEAQDLKVRKYGHDYYPPEDNDEPTHTPRNLSL